MSINFGCPVCKAVLSVGDHLANTKVLCGRCGQKLLVPLPMVPAPRNKTILGEIVEPKVPIAAPSNEWSNPEDDIPVGELVSPPNEIIIVGHDAIVPFAIDPRDPKPGETAKKFRRRMADQLARKWGEMGPLIVRVSAILLRWPDMCACCCGQSDSEIGASHTRVTGKRVIRTNTRSWKVPYCSRCLDHVEAGLAASRLPESNRLWLLASTVSVVLPFLLCCGLSVTIAAATNKSYENTGGFLIIGSFILSSVIATFRLVACIYMYVWSGKKLQAEKDDELDRAESLCFAACPTVQFDAVEYLGWYGTVHSFCFLNPVYAAAFIEANRKKVVNFGRA